MADASVEVKVVGWVRTTGTGGPGGDSPGIYVVASSPDVTDYIVGDLVINLTGYRLLEKTSASVLTDHGSIQGIQGDPGPKGDQGDPGPQGIQGEQGPPGADGAVGPQGDPGPQGIQGPPGADGADGQDGAPGPKGDQGDPGPQGIQGEQGPQGIQGEQGPQGPAGSDGAPGADGADGQDGADAPFVSPTITFPVDSTVGTVQYAYVVPSAARVLNLYAKPRGAAASGVTVSVTNGATDMVTAGSSLDGADGALVTVAGLGSPDADAAAQDTVLVSVTCSGSASGDVVDVYLGLVAQ